LELIKLIHISELKSAKGIPYCPQHIRKLIKQKKFPQPLPGIFLTTFIEEEIDAYVEGLIAERDATVGA
jgi:predicted DNA-binding transcriptional regulator AlpA